MCPSSAAMVLSTRRLRARRGEPTVGVRFGAADSDGPAYGDSSSTLVKREREAWGGGRVLHGSEEEGGERERAGAGQRRWLSRKVVTSVGI